MPAQTIRRTAGFTLVELLTVISVVALMTTLLVSASSRFIASARVTATIATINKVNGIIQERIRAFHESKFRNAAVVSTTRFNTTDVNLSEILVRKIAFKQAFPQAFAELSSSAQTRLFGTTVPPTNPEYQQKYEPGIVLYAFLQKGRAYGAPTPGDDVFLASEIKNSPETGNLPCLVDAWGEPIRFYRWPTRLIRCGEASFGDYNGDSDSTDPAGCTFSGGLVCGPAIRPYSLLPGPTPASLLMPNLPVYELTSSYARGLDQSPGNINGTTILGWPDSDDPEPLNIDPDDPSAHVLSWTDAAQKAAFVSLFHDLSTYHAPLIVSSGPDRNLGLYPPNDTSANCGYMAAPILPVGLSGSAALTDLFDNITNYNQRAGGRQ